MKKPFSKTETMILETKEFTMKLVVSEDSETKMKVANYRMPATDMVASIELGEETIVDGFITITIENSKGESIRLDNLSFEGFNSLVSLVNRLSRGNQVGLGY